MSKYFSSKYFISPCGSDPLDGIYLQLLADVVLFTEEGFGRARAQSGRWFDAGEGRRAVSRRFPNQGGKCQRRRKCWTGVSGDGEQAAC